MLSNATLSQPAAPRHDVRLIDAWMPDVYGLVNAELRFSSPYGELTLLLECERYRDAPLQIGCPDVPAASRSVVAKISGLELAEAAGDAVGADFRELMENSAYSAAALQLVVDHHAAIVTALS